jgi:peptide-methionine (S)-S-oxide reductase
VAKEQATLAGGCFWCLEAVYEQLKGVEKVVSGYAGGAKDDPSYEEVCGGDTGHAEVVQVTYDPKLVSFKEILDVFFSIHDPTTLNRQGNDVGTQYRSAVFYHDAQQKRAAEAAIADITKKGVWDDPIVTSLEPLTKFFPAEEYHQHYYARNPTQGYCRVVIAPKVAKFRKTWESRLRANA